MATPQSYRDLIVWKSSLEMVAAVYRLTDGYPVSERFGIVAQMRRAAVSVCANIAEGNSRHSTGAYVNHLHIALGSLGELRALVEISERLGFLAAAETGDITARLDEVGRLLSGLRAALKHRLERHERNS